MHTDYGMRITGIAAYASPRVVTNDEIAERLRLAMVQLDGRLTRERGQGLGADERRKFMTNPRWIQKSIGFTERRFCQPGMGTIDLAVEASRLLMNRTGVPPTSIGAILFGTVTSSYLYSPPDAALLQEALGIPAWDGALPRETFGADVALACSTWGAALRIAYRFMDEVEHVLVIGADAMSTAISWHDRAFACVLGNAGTATLCSRVPPEQDWFGSERFFSWLDGSRADVISTPVGGSKRPLETHEELDTYQHRLRMDGARVREDMVPFISGPGIDAVLTKARLNLADIDHLVLHEANVVLNRGIVGNWQQRGFRGAALDAGGRFGNTTSASIPLALALNPDALRIGKTIALVAFGGGYSMNTAIATIKHPFPVWANV
ncbi:MAG: hypothetical protein HY421_02850 [Candidatus Kerfeldbacteria bacterium]|nr:hypothetical protein [Candidatus Kerfeldbacteria bacterium]